MRALAVVKYCKRCNLRLGEQEQGVVLGEDTFHETCWDLYLKQSVKMRFIKGGKERNEDDFLV